MSILAWIEDRKRLKLLNAPQYVNPASDSSRGLWTRCDKCGVILYIKHLKENQRVCFGCSYHLQMSSQERVENLLDKSSWRPLDETVSPCDPLRFHDQKDYTDRLQEAQERTGLQDAIQTGSGMVDGIPIALGVMDFEFMGGSMGSVVGEKVTRLIEYATQEGLTLVLVCASGGARMQEGVFSLMQMAKISSALQVYQTCANLLYISILTSPTTGGVTASFAMLGDIIFAEPKALVAFAGRRVIEQTLCEDLPEDFQTSEYMLHHGLLDLIVPRRFFRQALSETIRLYKNRAFQKPGRIPFGVQNPITFLVEERIRRRLSSQAASKVGLLGGLTSVVPPTEVDRVLSPLGSPQGTTYVDSVGGGMNLLGESLFQEEAFEPYSPSESSLNAGIPTGVETGAISQLASHSSSAPHPDPISQGPKQIENPLASSPDGEEVEDKSACLRLERGYGASLETSNIVDLLLPRDTSDYRNILTSFQTMFHLFSKDLAVPYSLTTTPTDYNGFEGGERSQSFMHTKPEKSKPSTGFAKSGKGSTNSPFSEKDHGPDKFLALRTCAQEEQELLSDLLLQNFMALSKTQNSLQGHISIGETNQSSKLHETDSSYKSELVEKAKPHGLDSSSIYRDFCNQSIELAATESVEWRAFYVHQSVSQTTGFLEDLVESSLEDKQNIPPFSLQNRLFYRSICRKTES